MKKFFMMLIMAVAVISANAQEKKHFASGSLGYGYNFDTEVHRLTVAPEVGTYLTEKVALGMELNYTLNSGAGTTHAFDVNPYVRYDFAKCGERVVFFADFGVSVGYETAQSTTWSIGVKPGIKVELSDNLAFIAKVGMLGYSDNAAGKKVGFDFSTNGLCLGLEYAF